MNGLAIQIRKKKWQNASEFQLVRTLDYTSTLVLILTCNALEQFETRDVRWAPDGKGFILMDRDQFCCAFEVEAEEP